MTRTLLLSLESRYALDLPAKHPIIEWIVRHTTWIVNRHWKAGNSTATPFELQFDREYKSPCVPLGETVMWKDPGPQLETEGEVWQRHLGRKE